MPTVARVAARILWSNEAADAPICLKASCAPLASPLNGNRMTLSGHRALR